METIAETIDSDRTISANSSGSSKRHSPPCAGFTPLPIPARRCGSHFQAVPVSHDLRMGSDQKLAARL